MDQYEKWASESRSLCPELYDLADIFLSHATCLVDSVVSRNGEHLETSRLLLLGRIISGTRALVLLVRSGFLTEADILFRSNLEALLRLSALVEQPSLLDSYLGEDYPRRKRAMADIRELLRDVPNAFPSPDDLDAALRDIDRQETEFLKQTGLNKTREMKVWEWASAGKQTDLFFAKYVKHSGATHHAARDLERRLILSEDGSSIRAMTFCPETTIPTDILRDSLLLLGEAVVCYAKSRNVELHAELQAARVQLNAHFEQEA